jgi:hypothetical protein
VIEISAIAHDNPWAIAGFSTIMVTADAGNRAVTLVFTRRPNRHRVFKSNCPVWQAIDELKRHCRQYDYGEPTNIRVWGIQ